MRLRCVFARSRSTRRPSSCARTAAPLTVTSGVFIVCSRVREASTAAPQQLRVLPGRSCAGHSRVVCFDLCLGGLHLLGTHTWRVDCLFIRSAFDQHTCRVFLHCATGSYSPLQTTCVRRSLDLFCTGPGTGSCAPLFSGSYGSSARADTVC
ncbi:hypothetical protein C8R47DRAFT_1171227 [Mycena vitilis]|nr:hypothetical protein C8R47DRAFT_1171227 [Mycena vitilis]